MKNIVAKIPGEDSSIIMLATHYDTLLRNDIVFVGADDAGSSTGSHARTRPPPLRARAHQKPNTPSGSPSSTAKKP